MSVLMVLLIVLPMVATLMCLRAPHRVAAAVTGVISFVLAVALVPAVRGHTVTGLHYLRADAVSGPAAPRRGDSRFRTIKQGKRISRQAQGEPAIEIAAELREIVARAESLIAKLEKSGATTAEELAAQRQRFRW